MRWNPLPFGLGMVRSRLAGIMSPAFGLLAGLRWGIFCLVAKKHISNASGQIRRRGRPIVQRLPLAAMIPFDGVALIMQRAPHLISGFDPLLSMSASDRSDWRLLYETNRLPRWKSSFWEANWV